MQKILLVGHSHIQAIAKAISLNFSDSITSVTVNLNDLEVAARSTPGTETAELIPNAILESAKKLLDLKELSLEQIPELFDAYGVKTVLSVGGNAPNTLGLLQIGQPYDFVFPGDQSPLVAGAEQLDFRSLLQMFKERSKSYIKQVDAICRSIRRGLFFVEAPPVKSDEKFLEERLDGYFRDILKGQRPVFTPASTRLKLWKVNSLVFREAATTAGATYVDTPNEAKDEGGYLIARAYHDATHANEWYGALVVSEVLARLREPDAEKVDASTRKARIKLKTPYSDQDTRAFWKQSISDVPCAEVDPVEPTAVKIKKNTKVVTAGSCFAQHIARKLMQYGFNYYVTETAHPLLDSETARLFNYGTFSARYGNIYTSRQLDQLFDRVYGAFSPADSVWTLGDMYVDPFRPRIQPGGFVTEKDLLTNREKHFSAVRRAFEELDVFVFTLGLTECWVARADGAAFPLCPGVAGGEFDEEKYSFCNLTVDDVVADMTSFIAKLRSVNPEAIVLLTVSPVPLVATATDHHVLNATTYSKSVLRVAAEHLCALKGVYYFPSFEIITGSYSRGNYYTADAREIEERGVQHVMSLFFKHYADTNINEVAVGDAPSSEEQRDVEKFKADIEKAVQTICDEEALGRS